ncbi:MAG: hypothetical protein RLZZ124_1235 [Cyanobacteriota bacterium]
MGGTQQRLWGTWAEQRALRLLLGRGWRPVACRWSCRWGEIDLLMRKPRRLLLVEVKGRRRCGPDGWGVAGLDRRKRRRLAAAYGLWLSEHPSYAHCSLELVCALVPLPPARGPVRWLRWS